MERSRAKNREAVPLRGFEEAVNQYSPREGYSVPPGDFRSCPLSDPRTETFLDESPFEGILREYRGFTVTGRTRPARDGPRVRIALTSGKIIPMC